MTLLEWMCSCRDCNATLSSGQEYGDRAGYHQAMNIGSLKLWITLTLAALMTACAPTAPRPMPQPTVAPSPDLAPYAPRGHASRGERRADAEVQALRSALNDADMGTDLALSLLIDFPLNELTWQWQQLDGSQADDRALRPWLHLAVLARRHLLDDDALVAAMREWANQHPQLAALGPPPAQWVQAWRAIQPPPGGIAVWLPTEAGPLGRAGEALREGLMTAWLALPHQQRPALYFVYADGESDADITATLARVAALDAELMIGPLARPQVEAVLQHPHRIDAALLLNEPVSSDLAFDLSARPLTRFALLPEDEAMVAADLALAQGHRRALILAQDSDWGRRLAEAFETAMRAGGGQVLGSGFYGSNQVDHSDLLEALLGLNESSARLTALSRLLGEDLRSEPQRRSDIDVIFLASRADEARLLRPQLRFFRAEAVPVVATSYSLDGVPDPHRDADLRGIFMPLPSWFLEAPPAANLRRQAGFDNPTLSRLFAMGHDSLNMAIWLDRMSEDRELELPALTGRLHVSDSGRVIRRLDAVELGRGQRP